VRELDYFYHPLVNTPFSLGIALPRDYGKFRVDARVDVERTPNGMNREITRMKPA